MLAIVTTHPIQYQVPLWRALAENGGIPFEVWYLSHHAAKKSYDSAFRTEFAWDIDLLAGYPSRLLRVPPNSTPNAFFESRIIGSPTSLLQDNQAKVLWIQGWQVAAYWQMAWAAKRSGCRVWLRGESNLLAPRIPWKEPIKRLLLGSLFSRVDSFLCIGSANRRLYREYGIPASRLHNAPYAVDNFHFAANASTLLPNRNEIRRAFNIPDGAVCVLFCGKFVHKKFPQHVVQAVSLARQQKPDKEIHILFVGSGELGDSLRAQCNVVYDAAGTHSSTPTQAKPHSPNASFAGFLNQSEISRAYVAADCLILPSDFGETWGLVVNEANASGLPCIISNRCGCAEDMGTIAGNRIFNFGDIAALADEICKQSSVRKPTLPNLHLPNFAETVNTVAQLYKAESSS